MSMFLADLRIGRKYGIIFGSVIMAACALVLAVIGVWFYFFNEDRDLVRSDGTTIVPLEIYVPATYETFQCFHIGPDQCEQFDNYAEFVSETPVEFTYPPFNEDGPGKSNGDGTNTVTLDASLSDEEWQEIGRGVTLDGTAQGESLTPEEVALNGSVAEAAVPLSDGDSARLSMEFEHSGGPEDPSNVQVLAVRYEESEQS